MIQVELYNQDLDKWLFDFFTKNENKSFLNTLHVDGWNINKNKKQYEAKINYICIIIFSIKC